MIAGKFDRALAIEEITRLLFAYAEAIDKGDFVAVGQVLDGARFGDGDPRNAQQIEEIFRHMVITYENGVLRTKHVVTNINITFEEDNSIARSRAYYAVSQALPFPEPKIEVILAGTYSDVFEHTAGRWRFRQRSGDVDLIGNLQYHLREEALKRFLSVHAVGSTV